MRYDLASRLPNIQASAGGHLSTFSDRTNMLCLESALQIGGIKVVMMIDDALKATGARTIDRYGPLEVNSGCS